jgi:hypothetical protein
MNCPFCGEELFTGYSSSICKNRECFFGYNKNSIIGLPDMEIFSIDGFHIFIIREHNKTEIVKNGDNTISTLPFVVEYDVRGEEIERWLVLI